MLKVLLIDDEEIITKGLKKLIDWDSLGLEIIGTAKDGDEALEVAKATAPDIIITDIKMYEVSGLDFAEEYKKLNPQVKLIALSGYSEFSYVKRALEIGFFNYLLKPVDKKELLSVLENAKTAILTERTPKEKAQASTAEITERFYKTLLFGKEIDEKYIEETAKSLSLNDGVSFYVFSIKLYLDDATFENYERAYLLMEKAMEMIAKEYEFNFSLFHKYEIATIVINKQGGGLNYLQIASMLYERMSEEEIVLEIGIGNEADGYDGLKKAFSQAITACDNSFFADTGAVSYEQVLRLKSNFISSANNYEKKIIDCILYLTDDDIPKLAQSQMDYFLSISGGEKDSIYNNCYELYLKIKDALISEGYTENRANVFNEITSCRTLITLQNWLIEEINSSVEIVKNIKKDREQDIVEIAKEYLKNNFHEQITIDLLAKKLFVSPTYFCYLFKSKVGIGYHEYILNIRMQEAIKLLASKKYKIYEVAAKVGYSNSRYFSEVFKKYFGFIPTEFDIVKHKHLIK